MQVIEKFSFIYTLTHSRDKNTQQLAKKVSVDIQKCPNKARDKPCHELVPSSESDSVTLSSILGFPTFTAGNEASLSLADEPIYNDSLYLSEHLELSAEENPSRWFIFRHLGKILFAVSSGYFVFVTWWLTCHNYYGKLFPFSALRAIINISEEQISAADLEFIDYMERSLASIELQQETESSNADDRAENSEVVYVPVYNLNDADPVSKTNSSEITFPLNSSVSNSLPIPVIPPPPPMEVPTKNFSSSSMNADKNTTAISPSTAPSSPAKTNTSSNSTPSPAIDSTLLGIVELGDKSAALVKVNGVTKRIWVGEKLDNNGWILDSVANQKAKIINQGTVRYISVGEKF